MRSLAGAWLLGALALEGQGCATFATYEVVQQQTVTSSQVLEQRRAGPASLEATVEGSALRLSGRTQQLCERATRIEGTRAVQVERRAESLGVQTLFAVVGGLVAAGGVAAGVAGFNAPGGLDPVLLGAGGGGVVGGLLLTVPLMVARAGERRSVEVRPYAEVLDRSERGCGEEPSPALRYELRAADRSWSAEGQLDAEGRGEVDLLARLPAEAWAGAARWQELEVLVGGRVVSTVALEGAREEVARRRWQATQEAPTEETLRAFARDFPESPGAAEVPARLERLRAEARAIAQEQERRARWSAARGSTERLEALAAEDTRDGFWVAAVCALARQRPGASAAEALQRCARAREGVSASLRARSEGAHAEAERDYEELAAAAQRAAEAERAARRAAEEAERAAQREAEERERRRAEQAQRLERRRREQAQAAADAGLAAARDTIARCRAGAGGVELARRAYQALAAARGLHGEQVRPLALQVAAACRATPTQAGVAAP